MTTWSGTLPTWLSGEEIPGTDLQTMMASMEGGVESFSAWVREHLFEPTATDD